MCVCVYGLQKLQSGRGELLSQLSAAKKQASEQEEKAERRFHALESSKRKLQVSFCFDHAAYAVDCKTFTGDLQG